LGRAPKHQKKKLLCTATGDWFRVWLEDILWNIEESSQGKLAFERGAPNAKLVRFLSAETDVDEKQIRTYLKREEPNKIKDIKGRNPNVETAIKIAKGLRAHSPRSNPLLVLFTVSEFQPHGWGVVGKICRPGPTKEVLAIWPAIRWLILPKATLEEEALAILQSDHFAEVFDQAWRDWFPAESTSGYPDCLRVAIEHARECRNPKYWDLTDGRLEGWVDHVAESPEMFGRGMRQLDGRALCAREVFNDEFEHWDKHRIIEPNTLIRHSVYLYGLLDGEREALAMRAKEILQSSDEMRRYADMLH
jgi:hypothetical protein